MHEMQTIAIDDPGVCQSGTRAGCAKTAEQIDVLSGVETHGDARNSVLDGVPMSPWRCGFLPNYFGHFLLYSSLYMLRFQCDNMTDEYCSCGSVTVDSASRSCHV